MSTKELLRQGKAHIYTSFSCYFSNIYTQSIVLFSLTELVNKRQTIHGIMVVCLGSFSHGLQTYCVWHTNNWLIYPFSKVNNQHCVMANEKKRLNRRRFHCSLSNIMHTSELIKVILRDGFGIKCRVWMQSSKMFRFGWKVTNKGVNRPLQTSEKRYNVELV